MPERPFSSFFLFFFPGPSRAFSTEHDADPPARILKFSCAEESFNGLNFDFPT